MKPKINVVFPDIKSAGLVDAEVEKIKISRHRRRMELLLSVHASEEALDKFETELQKYYRLNGVNLREQNDEDESLPEAEVMYITKKSTKGFRTQEAGCGKAHITDVIYGSSIRSELVPISSINEDSERVSFRGEVFGVETKDITSKKSGKSFHLVVFDVTDYADSITCQMFIATDEKGNAAYDEVKSRLKKGLNVVVRGKAQYNDYAKEVIVMANGICETEPPPARIDEAPVKRVELHLHTQMSAMDGVSSAKDLINRAVSWGHSAIAITDHGVVQAFPDALKASDNNAKIKIIYGMEGYLVDDSLTISENASDETIDSDFVVFDIETTGLSAEDDEITEIGAVKVSGGKVVDRWSTFVNPKRPIPENIVKLTGITDEMVSDAPVIGDILGEFFDFCRGAVLVAHNATFDTGFIKAAAARAELDYSFCSLDTLQLARCLYPELRNHKLDNLTKHLGVILENHHRAVNDAKATADVFIKMLDELRTREIFLLDKLNTRFDMRDASKRTKAYHIILLAKNLIGIRHLYELVTASQLNYFYRTPRIPRSLLSEKREGLIIGSACEAGELFRAMVEGASDEKLENIARFYD